MWLLNFCCVVELTYNEHAASVAQLHQFHVLVVFYTHNHTAHHPCMVPVIMTGSFTKKLTSTNMTLKYPKLIYHRLIR